MMNRDAWLEVNRSGIELAKVMCQAFSPITTGPYRTRFWAVQCHSSRVEVMLEDRTLVAGPGDWTIMPPGTSRTFRFLEQCQHRVIHFWSGAKTGRDWDTVLLHTGAEADRLNRLHMTAFQYCVSQPQRAEAVARYILWELADFFSTEGTANALHPAVERAVAFIEESYRGPLRVADAVGQSGISHNHLTSLFRKAFGMTVVEYIRDRRMREAKYLLQQTDMPVKQIAVEVGVPDLQHFNRTIHRQFNCSPRTLRSEQ